MNDLLDVTLMTSAFVTLFVIMDPVGTVPIFLSLTSGRSKATARRAAWQAVAVSFVVNKVSPLPTQVAWWSILLAFGVSVAVGVFFGVAPARRAGRLDPVVALRAE